LIIADLIIQICKVIYKGRGCVQWVRLRSG
jgi:hypothetical protein